MNELEGRIRTEKKRKADVLGRFDSSSNLGRGSLSGWTLCPLCPPNRKKQYALGRGISAHLHAVHAPWLPKKRKKSNKKQRANEDEDDCTTSNPNGWESTVEEEEAWALRVAEITSKLEEDLRSRPGVDRSGKPSVSYRDSLPPFLAAASNGVLLVLQSLIKEAEEKGNLSKLLSVRDRNGSAAEHWAAGGGHIECLKLILESGDKVPRQTSANDDDSNNNKVRRRDGKTCLHYAARNGQLECIRFLVEERGEDVNAPSGDGTTPLHMACYGGSNKVLMYLLDRGADVSAVNDWSCSPSHWIAMSQHKDHEEVILLCQTLMKAGTSFATVQRQGHSALHKAAQKQNRHILEWLAQSSDKNGPGLTPSQRKEASKPDDGGHRPSDIWLSAGGDPTFAAWIKATFEEI